MTSNDPIALARSFAAHLPAEALAETNLAELGARLADILQTSRTTWPAIRVDDAAFLRHLATHMPTDEAVAKSLESWFASDLYLAHACAVGEPAALRYLESHYLARLHHRSRDVGVVEDELLSALRARILVAEGGAPPRIAGFSGRGPLGAWLRIAASRLSSNLRKSGARASRVDVASAGLQAADLDPENGYVKDVYAPHVAEAFQATLTALPTRLANVVRMFYLDQVTLEAIGATTGVSARTVQRWLREARQQILRETRRILAERLRVPDSEVDSLLGLVRSRLNLSIRRHLRTRPPEEP